MILNGLGAAAAAGRICRVSIGIGNSELIKSLRTPENPCEILDFSETSALSAAIAASLNSKRVLLHTEVTMKPLALARVPVLSVSSEPANWALCFAPSNAQEIIDDIIVSYIISEQKKILLPSRIVVDRLAQETGQQVTLPVQKSIEKFLKPLDLGKPEKHFQTWSNLSEQEAFESIHRAMENASKAFEELKKTFYKSIGAVGSFYMEDATFAFVCYGSISNNVKLAITELRKFGERVGLVRLHALRPWPEMQLRRLLENVPSIAVLDTQISAGTWPKLYQGLKTWYNGTASAYIFNNYLSVKDIIEIYKNAVQSKKPELVWYSRR